MHASVYVIRQHTLWLLFYCGIKVIEQNVHVQQGEVSGVISNENDAESIILMLFSSSVCVLLLNFWSATICCLFVVANKTIIT